MKFSEIMDMLPKNQIIDSLIIILISYLIYKGINKVLFTKQGVFKIGNKNSTYMHMLKSIIKYIIIVITALVLLQVNGVNVSSLLAGIGILSVVIGLALQDALKDIIRGFNILADSYFKINDVIKYNGIEGKVIAVGLQTTKVKDITNQNIIAIANRNIEQVEIVSNQLDIEVPLSYELSIGKAEDILNKIVEQIKKNEKVETCNYIGLNKLDDSSLNYLIRINCDPATKYQTKRDSQVVIMNVLEENKIEVPYNQVDVHTK